MPGSSTKEEFVHIGSGSLDFHFLDRASFSLPYNYHKSGTRAMKPGGVGVM